MAGSVLKGTFWNIYTYRNGIFRIISSLTNPLLINKKKIYCYQPTVDRNFNRYTPFFRQFPTIHSWWIDYSTNLSDGSQVDNCRVNATNNEAWRLITRNRRGNLGQIDSSRGTIRSFPGARLDKWRDNSWAVPGASAALFIFSLSPSPHFAREKYFLFFFLLTDTAWRIDRPRSNGVRPVKNLMK